MRSVLHVERCTESLCLILSFHLGINCSYSLQITYQLTNKISKHRTVLLKISEKPNEEKYLRNAFFFN